MKRFIMKYLGIILCILTIGVFSAPASPPTNFTSTVTVTMTIGRSTVDQATADAQKASYLQSFALAHQLDIYTDSTRTVIDSTKVAPAVLQFYKNDFATTVQEYNARTAGNTAAAAQRVTDAGLVP